MNKEVSLSSEEALDRPNAAFYNYLNTVQTTSKEGYLLYDHSVVQWKSECTGIISCNSECSTRRRVPY